MWPHQNLLESLTAYDDGCNKPLPALRYESCGFAHLRIAHRNYLWVKSLNSARHQSLACFMSFRPYLTGKTIFQQHANRMNVCSESIIRQHKQEVLTLFALDTWQQLFVVSSSLIYLAVANSVGDHSMRHHLCCWLVRSQACGAELLGRAMEGFNGTIMCYGQTGEK